jgi:hypothetical protein
MEVEITPERELNSLPSDENVLSTFFGPNSRKDPGVSSARAVIRHPPSAVRVGSNGDPEISESEEDLGEPSPC